MSHAYPTLTYEYDGQGQVLQYQEPGMTLRDWFAGMALQGLLADPSICGSVEVFAKDAFALADAMMKQREVKP